MRFRKKIPPPLRHLLSLRSKCALLLFFLLYATISKAFFSEKIEHISSITPTCSFTSTDLYDPIRSSLSHFILDAKESVTLIIYSLSDPQIIDSLKASASKGIKVQVLYDQVESPFIKPLLGPLVDSIPCRGKGLMHMKMLVIDHAYVWLGSANISATSLTSQGNIVGRIYHKDLAQKIEALATCLQKNTYYSAAPFEYSSEEQTVSIFFHPYHGKSSCNALIEKIKTAKDRIFVAMFTFTHTTLAKELVEAHRRGVDVRVIFDKDSIKQTSKKIARLFQKEHIPYGYRKKKGLLHYKAAIIDTSLVMGSCNWTQAAFTINHETILIFSPLLENQLTWVNQWWQVVEQQSTLLRPLPKSP